jgi:hypothetical protein
MPQQQDQHPKVLYHYTSIDSFKKIIQEGKIRATRYDQMNDTSEINLGVERLLEAVKKHETDDSSREYKDFLVSEIECFNQETLEIYVLSFSAAKDSLDQWRAY